MKNNLTKMLAGYSALATSVIAAKNSSAQIDYHDAELILKEGQYADIDWNLDGMNDLRFDNRHYFKTTISDRGRNYGEPGHVSVVALYYFCSSSWGDDKPPMPIPLVSGKLIGTNKKWYDIQLGHSSADLIYTGCNANPWINKKNGFIGLRLADDYGSYYYGWLRLQVLHEGFIIKIKDWAINRTPNQSIYAGQTSIGDWNEGNQKETLPDQLSNHLAVYYSNNIISINTNNDQQEKVILIFNSEGKRLKRVITKDALVRVDSRDLPAGIYLVNVSASTWSQTKKVAVTQ